MYSLLIKINAQLAQFNIIKLFVHDTLFIIVFDSI